MLRNLVSITPRTTRFAAPALVTSSQTRNTSTVFGLRRRDVLGHSQFDKDTLEELFSVASNMKKVVDTKGGSEDLKGKFLANLFFEPSTRTASSFQVAMERLGGRVVSVQSQFSSAKKGETLADTVRVMENYVDGIVIRHPQSGAAATAAQFAEVPVINAGDGSNEHPTQALLDMFCVKDRLGKIEGVTFTLLGDLKFGRTVHSMAPLLGLYNCKVNLVSPDALRMPDSTIQLLTSKGVKFTQTSDLNSVLNETDVLYVTRVQQERFASEAEYLAVKGSYVIDKALMARAPRGMLVLHPLPRVDEISPEIDDDPRAMFFHEVRYGMIMRMAILRSVLGN